MAKRVEDFLSPADLAACPQNIHYALLNIVCRTEEVYGTDNLFCRSFQRGIEGFAFPVAES